VTASDVTIAALYPELLGTYGDGGNAIVLAQRLRWRGIAAEVIEVRADQPVPEACEAYVIGGGEDAPQSLAAEQLAAGGELHRAVDRGAVVLAVCAGLQVLGTTFVGPDGTSRPGLGLLDCATGRTTGKRAVGEIVVEPSGSLGLPTLTGYENHAGVTTVGAAAAPLGRVVRGVGNGAGDGSEGVVTGRVVGTYLHGPALARNPALADLLLGWVVGPLTALDDAEVDALRADRLAAAGTGRDLRSWGRRLLRR
jgi:CobQ-like glutamine amidotransferase family enzyme